MFIVVLLDFSVIRIIRDDVLLILYVLKENKLIFMSVRYDIYRIIKWMLIVF